MPLNHKRRPCGVIIAWESSERRTIHPGIVSLMDGLFIIMNGAPYQSYYLINNTKIVSTFNVIIISNLNILYKLLKKDFQLIFLKY